MEQSSEFGISVERNGPRLSLRLRGALGPDAAAVLHPEAVRIATGDEDVEIDWSAAEHVSAAALQVLIALDTALSARGRKLVIANDNPGVRQFLEAAGLSSRFAAGGKTCPERS
jgi:anti-anti-sigma regulatory factor